MSTATAEKTAISEKLQSILTTIEGLTVLDGAEVLGERLGAGDVRPVLGPLGQAVDGGQRHEPRDHEGA